MTLNKFSNLIDRNEVIARLNTRNTSGPIFTYLKPAYEQIYQLIENTCKFRESKSAIVIGPRGIGKTFLIEKAINELQNVQNHEFFTIRISGLFFKDDAKAIKEIARQLDWYLEKYNPSERENLKRATFEQKSIINTMNVIIEILDRTRLNEEQEENYKKEEEYDDEGKLINNSKKGQPTLFIPIVFIIDEIDRYTHSAKQTLLYNLFDMAQSSSSRTDNNNYSCRNGTTISVIGLSTKATVREQLEKRVKSRFSQRIIQINKVKELEDFCNCVYEMISIPENNNEDRKAYNRIVKSNIFDNGTELRKLIVQNFYTIKDLNGLRNELIVYIMSQYNQLMYQHIKDYNNRNINLIRGLSESELKLLICCCRVKIKNDISHINFDMAFEEYHEMMLAERREIQSKIQVAGMSLQENNGNYLLDRNAIQICWERLCFLGLLVKQSISFHGNIHNISNKTTENRIKRSDTSTVNSSSTRRANHQADAVGAMTPGGVAICGVELDDISVDTIRSVDDQENTVSWIDHWKML